jgi:glycosyltransferase family protein
MNLRSGKLFKYPRKIAKHVLSLYYHVVVRMYSFPKVKSIVETLDFINEHRCSVSRFGDGELSIVVDKASYPFQRYDSRLAARLTEVLRASEPGILICLPVGFQSLDNLTPSIRVAWKAHVAMVYPRLVKFLDLGKVYFNASITRPYISYQNKNVSTIYFRKVMQIWENRHVLLIEGEKSRLGVSNDLFSKVSTLKRILAPAQNAFDKYTEIIEAAKKYPQDYLILVALGPTATVLAYDLHKAGYQAIDIGNVDIEYEWYRMGTNEKVKVNGKYTSEVAGGSTVADVNDKAYYLQIEKKIV